MPLEPTHTCNFDRWRPLQRFADAHSASTVEEVTRAAFTSYDDGSIVEAMKILVTLRGVGPATASAVLSAYAPADVPFMQDEALVCGTHSLGFLSIAVGTWI